MANRADRAQTPGRDPFLGPARLTELAVPQALNPFLCGHEPSSAWHCYIKFAAYVVGISGGVRIHELERYISAPKNDEEVLILTSERWTLEVYRTVIETLQGIAWMFLLVFVVALVAYVLARGFESKRLRASQKQT